MENTVLSRNQGQVCLSSSYVVKATGYGTNLNQPRMMGDSLTFAVMPLLSPRPHHHLGTDAPSIRADMKGRVTVTLCKSSIIAHLLLPIMMELVISANSEPKSARNVGIQRQS
ncbi:hypothetical protein Krac_1812 [Ktedonobacter racemifer DSM 44963]|uniref:Uncharacterized protein n=1 Tax=Ktedonobacter racemifer DSM 44963 TaxID=485913 RepID=D6U3B8_KTERA|nr:hypothetical protein Krac_1812 [Ktedonobacter racemifer DSM 44963]